MQARDRVIEIPTACQSQLQPLQPYNYNCYDESTGKCHGTDPVGWSELHGGSCYCYDLCQCLLDEMPPPPTTTTVSQPPNNAPVVSRPIQDYTKNIGETFAISLRGHFSDPDGDNLSFTAHRVSNKGGKSKTL